MRPAQLQRHLLKQFEHKNTCLVTGAPGVGKTAVIKSVRDLYNEKYKGSKKADLIISHPVVKDSSDYRGLGALVDGKAEFLPFGDLRQMMDAKNPTLWFFDDFGQASPSVQAAGMQLLLERELDGKKISDEVVFFAATNRASDRAGVSGILEPVKSRFKTIVNFTVNQEDWITWAFANKMPSELISFIRFKPTFLTAEFTPSREIVNSTSPRTIAHVGEQQLIGIETEVEFEVIEGAAGKAFATEYCSFLRLSRDLPTAEDILKNPDTIKIPKEASELYAICGSLAYALTEKTFDKGEIFLKRLPSEFGVMTLRDAMGINPSVTSCKGVDRWFSENASLILA